MKTYALRLCCALSLVLGIGGSLSVFAQGTTFTYQGRLTDGGAPANGTYDLRFILYDNSVGGSELGPILTESGTVVSNGLFAVTLDFGNQFPGADRFLEIAVRTNGAVSFATLSSRQPVTPAPYAITAGAIVSGGISGTYINAVTFNNSANSFGGSFSGNGGGLTNLNASTLNGFSSSSFWKTTGNSNTTAGLNYVGTADNQPLELRVNGMRALRLEWDANGTNAAPNVIAGSPANFVSNGVVGATISGGGALDYNSSPLTNSVTADFGTVAGGALNSADNFSTVGGGHLNTASGPGAAVGGGYENIASGYESVIGGGETNIAAGYLSFIGGGSVNSTLSFFSTVGGGDFNRANDEFSTVGGGYNNQAFGGSFLGATTVGGGYKNLAAGDVATVGGGFGNTASGVGSVVAGGGDDGGPLAGNTASGAASVVSGGLGNSAGNSYAVVGGGNANSAGGVESTISGGLQNVASGTASTVSGGHGNSATANDATVVGGNNNTASGFGSLAAGSGANAQHQGAFVWADTSGGTYSSDFNNQFKIRAAGGVIFDVSGSSGLNPAALRVNSTSGNGVGIFVAQTSSDATAVFTAAGTGDIIKGFNGDNGGNPVFEVFNTGDVTGHSFNSTSDRNLKENFSDVSTTEILDRVVSLPVTRWNFKSDADKEHIGPMAQDFHEAFGLNGADDKHISMVDEGGVALAAIQGLNRKLEDRSEELEKRAQELEVENADLKQTVTELKRLVTEINGKLDRERN